MKFGILYNKRFKYLNDIDELTIYYTQGSMELVNFLLNYEEKRINIYFKDNKYINKTSLQALKAIKEKYPQLNMYIKIDFNYNSEDWEDTFDIIKKCSIPYYFSEVIRDWETLSAVLDLEKQPSDIYIGEQLGFELKNVRDRIPQEIEIRAYANICQYTNPLFKNRLKTFFIRPEDVKFYENYIDTLEFYGVEDKEVSYAEVLYKVYAIDKKWFGDLSEIIVGLNVFLDSKTIYPAFAYSRSNCKRKCLSENKCKICDKISYLSETMLDKNLYFKEN